MSVLLLCAYCSVMFAAFYRFIIISDTMSAGFIMYTVFSSWIARFFVWNERGYEIKKKKKSNDTQKESYGSSLFK